MKPSPMKPMDSTVIKASHYDPRTQALTIEFHNGSVWQYEDVPHEKAEAFSGNASPGSYYGRKIKGLYEGRQIG